MSNDKQLIVRVRVIIGEEAYDSNQKPLFKSHVMPLHYDRLEWYNFLKNANRLFGNAKIEKVQEEHLSFEDDTDMHGKKIKVRKTKYVTVPTPESIIKELKDSFGTVETALTEDQKRILALEAKIEALSKDNKPAKKASPEKAVTQGKDTEINEELESARKKYHEVFEKKPNHLMKLENINKAIEEKLNDK